MALKFIGVVVSDMAVYICLAANGVPPSLSQRISVNVECKARRSKSLLPLGVILVCSSAKSLGGAEISGSVERRFSGLESTYSIFPR